MPGQRSFTASGTFRERTKPKLTKEAAELKAVALVQDFSNRCVIWFTENAKAFNEELDGIDGAGIAGGVWRLTSYEARMQQFFEKVSNAPVTVAIPEDQEAGAPGTLPANHSWAAEGAVR
jgi:hypothetical protein